MAIIIFIIIIISSIVCTANVRSDQYYKSYDNHLSQIGIFTVPSSLQLLPLLLLLLLASLYRVAPKPPLPKQSVPWHTSMDSWCIIVEHCYCTTTYGGGVMVKQSKSSKWNGMIVIFHREKNQAICIINVRSSVHHPWNDPVTTPSRPWNDLGTTNLTSLHQLGKSHYAIELLFSFGNQFSLVGLACTARPAWGWESPSNPNSPVT